MGEGEREKRDMGTRERENRRISGEVGRRKEMNIRGKGREGN